MWLFFAIGSALFAALTAILAKVGIENVNSTLATAIRTIIVLMMAWSMVFITNVQGEIVNISKKVGYSSSFRESPPALRGFATTKHSKQAMFPKSFPSTN